MLYLLKQESGVPVYVSSRGLFWRPMESPTDVYSWLIHSVDCRRRTCNDIHMIVSQASMSTIQSSESVELRWRQVLGDLVCWTIKWCSWKVGSRIHCRTRQLRNWL